MPSTFTNNGGIELPADGEKDGVWGDVVNLNMQIVDRLTNGVGFISLSGATHSLTTTNGTTSDGQYGLVVFGGSPSGANTVTILPNDAEKIYLVRNTTDQDVIMTQGSGGNATIPAGAGAIVYANGAGTGSAVADLTATFIPTLAAAGITATADEINILDGVTASTPELNILDGAIVPTDELNHVYGVTSPIQGQIDAKQGVITGAVTTIVSDDLAASRALISDGSGKVSVSPVTSDELATLDGITASTAELNLLDGVTATTTEINYIDGVTGPIQAQIDGKATDNELTQIEVEDDTSTVFGQVSGQRLAQAFNASEQQIGVGQTWQDLTGSRSAATSYQNTTGKPITVAVGNTGAGSFGELDVSTDNVNWITVGNLHPNTGMSAMAVVPHNHYYRLTNWNGTFWAELR